MPHNVLLPHHKDYHGMRIMDNYAFSFVCDGHGGATISVALGSAYMQSFLTRTSVLLTRENPETLRIGCF